MTQKRRKKNWIVPAAAGVILIAAGAVFVYKGASDRKPQESEIAASEGETQNHQTSSTGSVNWQGKTYVYNDHLSNFLFMGVDTREKTETSQGQADAGQTDALFLLSWDRSEHNIALVTIPRDTITDIEAFDVQGNSLGKSKDHISLAYGFGDGKNQSCELTKEAVSNLMFGIPIQGYCAINMDGIPILTESVGGVTVTVPDDSLEDVDPEFKEGAQVVLDKDNTETFVRYRDVTKSQSAIVRMNRQNVFLDAYAARAKEVFSENPGLLIQMYTDLDPYMVTNIGNDQLAKILQDASQENMRSRWTLPGEGTEGTSYDEYHVDDDKLYEMILETFHKETE